MAGRKRKCLICGESIEESIDSLPYKKGFVHKNCFNIAQKIVLKEKTEKLEEKKQEKQSKRNKNGTSNRKIKPIKDGLSEDEYKMKQEFYSTLKEIIGEDIPVRCYAITDSYLTKYRLTWKDLYLTLVYMKEYKDIDLTGDVVGLIPFVYSEAKKFYQSIEKIEENNKDIDMKDFYKLKTVRVCPKKNREKKQLDITTI